jgi:hypothetical protein
MSLGDVHPGAIMAECLEPNLNLEAVLALVNQIEVAVTQGRQAWQWEGVKGFAPAAMTMSRPVTSNSSQCYPARAVAGHFIPNLGCRHRSNLKASCVLSKCL